MSAGLAWTDYIVDATLSSDSAVASLPASNAKTDVLSQIWRSTATSAYLQADLGSTKSVDLVALLGANLVAADTRRVRVSDNSDMSSPTYDSTAAVPGGELSELRTQLVHRLASPASGRYVRVDLTGSSARECGRLVVALLTSFTHTFSFGWAWTHEPRSRKGRAEDGTLYVARRRAMRGIRASFPAVTTAEARNTLASMFQQAENGGNIIFVPDVAASTLGYDVVWGTMDGPLDIHHPFLGHSTMDIIVTERR